MSLDVKRMRRGLPLLLALLPLAWALSLLAGPYPLPPGRSARILWQGLLAGGVDAAPTLDQIVLLNIRAPRVLFGALAGAGLALGGTLMQALFRNPLADPGLIGLSSGAALAAAACTILPGRWGLAPVHPLMLPFWAFVGACAATLLVFGIARRGRQVDVEGMLLLGIAVNALCGALIGLLMSVANDAQLRNLTFWTFGSLGGADWAGTRLLAGVLAPLCLLSLRLARPLDALLLGEAEALALGVRTERLKAYAVALTCAGVGLIIAHTGLIGFVGLVVPHIARLLFGCGHHRLLPGSLFLGAAFLPLADAGARLAIAPAELPIGLVTALFGAPFFLMLLVHQRRRT